MRRRGPAPLARVGEAIEVIRDARLAPDVDPDAEWPDPPPTDRWETDVLGRGHEAITLPLDDDFEGEVVTTLVRYRPEIDPGCVTMPGVVTPRVRRVVLYLHGWSDYFFNHELGPFWLDNEAAFYAIDLRKYGRSLRRHQSAGYVDRLETYAEDIEAALAVVAQEHPGLPVVLMAHSTGGLTVSLWAHHNPGRVAGLVLVSPWLETQGSSVVRTLSTPLVTELAKNFPLRLTPQIDLGFYNRTISDLHDGEWSLVAPWRPTRSFPARYGWLAAVLRGHARVAKGLDVDVPVLVLRSQKSLISPVWDDAMTTSDIVIEVDVIAERALRIARNVTVATVPDAIHDVLLSKRPVRDVAYGHIARWAAGYLP